MKSQLSNGSKYGGAYKLTLAANPWLVLLGLVVTIIGTVSSFVFYYKGKRKKSLSYMVNTFNLVTDTLNKVKGISVTYDGKLVTNLSVTKFIIWNSGTETINGDDVPKKNRLRIDALDGVEILDHKVLHIGNDSNDITLKPAELVDYDDGTKSIDINFEYIDPYEDVVIQLYHTGTLSNQLTLNGKVKGITRGFTQIYEYGDRGMLGPMPNVVLAPKFSDRITYAIVGVLPSLLGGYLVFKFSSFGQPELVNFSILALFIFLTTTVYGIYYLRMAIKRVPKGFRLMFKDN
ncbi:hypothetical protein GCM10027443_26510 [Pontibacter brevis]